MDYISVRSKLYNIEKWKNTSKFSSTFINCYIETKTHIILPRMFAISKFGLPKKILLTDGEKMDTQYESQMILRDYQINAVSKIHDTYLEGIYGGMLVMPTGSGKTLTAIHISIALGLKTLIIVNTISLAKQWQNEIKKTLGIDVSIMKKPNKNDFTICVINSIYRGKFKWQTFQHIGLVIIDEIHSIISNGQLKIFNYISRRFILGLTATPNRLDGLEYLIKLLSKRRDF